MSKLDRVDPVQPHPAADPWSSVVDECLAAVLTASREAIAIVDLDGCLIACNRPARRIGLIPEQPSPGAVPPAPQAFELLTQSDAWPEIRRIGGTEDQPRFRRMALSRKDGKMLDLEITRISASEGRPGALLVLLSEQRPSPSGERNLADRQIGFAQTARQAGMSAIGTAMAHELNQPLTAMLLYLQTVQRLVGQEGQAPPAAIADLVGKSVREAQRAAEIVKRIRAIASRKEPSRSLVHLEDAIEESIELSLAGRSETVEVVRLFANVGLVRFDLVEIQQVLVNLLSNAFDAVASRNDGRVTVQTDRDGHLIRIAVSDNGMGISPQLMNRLFRPFESTKSHGLGIGLSISQAIAHAHGGDLLVDPGGSGRGACFTLVLPADQDPEAVGINTSHSDAHSPLPKTIGGP